MAAFTSGKTNAPLYCPHPTLSSRTTTGRASLRFSNVACASVASCCPPLQHRVAYSSVCLVPAVLPPRDHRVLLATRAKAFQRAVDPRHRCGHALKSFCYFAERRSLWHAHRRCCRDLGLLRRSLRTTRLVRLRSGAKPEDMTPVMRALKWLRLVWPPAPWTSWRPSRRLPSCGLRRFELCRRESQINSAAVATRN